MFGKECGDFHPVIFEGVAGAEQFIFFAVLVVVGDFRTGVKIVVAELKPRGAYRRPVDGLLFFLRWEGVA